MVITFNRCNMANKTLYTVATASGQDTALTIVAGQTTNATALFCSGTAPAALIFPSNWTSSNVTFQLSSDGTNFYNLTGVDGTLVSVPTVASQWLPLEPILFHCALFIKITSSAPQINTVTINSVLAPYHQGVHA